MKVVNNLDTELWRQFVDEHPAGNIFHTPEMFQVFANAKGHQPELWAVTDSNGARVLALLPPVRVNIMNGLFHYLTTRSVAYGSVLSTSDDVGHSALKLLLNEYIHNVGKLTLFTELRNLSDLCGIQPILNDMGFVYGEHLNFLISLERPVDEIWRSVKSDVRTNVRKARKMGVVVEEAASIDEIRSGYSILQNVYRRIQVPLALPSLFERAFEQLYPLDMFRCFLARANDRYIGVAFRLLYKGAIYAWYAGANKEYASHKAQDLLNWHILEWGAENGYKLFDFGGAGKPDEDYGPRKFKAKFGGELVNYGRNVCIHAPLRLKLSQLGYQLYRRL